MHFFPPKTLNPGWANSKLGWAKYKKNRRSRTASYLAQSLSQYLLQYDFLTFCCSFCHKIIVAYRVLPKFVLNFFFIKCPDFFFFQIWSPYINRNHYFHRQSKRRWLKLNCVHFHYQENLFWYIYRIGSCAAFFLMCHIYLL